MKTFSYLSVCSLMLLAPFFVHAGVIINEVAWMGTALSSTAEWIELYNNGDAAVSLAGWKLVADDGTPSVSLSGSIAPDAYYLLERTKDETVPGVTADKIYSGDLGNTGETLRLLDTSGGAVDTVIGGTNWSSIGGDNTTKDTPQRQLDGSWITGGSTPKATNTSVSSTPPAGEIAGTSTSKGPTPRKRVVTGGYKQIVFGYAGEDATGIVGAAVSFEGYAISDKNVRLPTALYQWSFGDGAHAKGKSVTHAYEEPGTYTATLRVFGDNQKWQDTISVTILPATVSLAHATGGERGYIAIENTSDVAIDLGNWQLVVLPGRRSVPERRFTFPEATIIAAHTSVRFSSRITGLYANEFDTIVLTYPSHASADALMVGTSSPETL